MNANDNRLERERRIEIDCWLEGGSPYLVSVFEPNLQSEPVVSDTFDTAGTARIAAKEYARLHNIFRIYDETGEAS
jgi:hypothetical protein